MGARSDGLVLAETESGWEVLGLGPRPGSVTDEPCNCSPDGFAMGGYGPLALGPFVRPWERPRTVSHDGFVFLFLQQPPNCMSLRTRKTRVRLTVGSMTAVHTRPFTVRVHVYQTISWGGCGPGMSPSGLAVDF